MSTIGSGGFVPPIASSVAGATGQQKTAEINRTNQEGAERKFQLDRAAQSEKALGDIGESNQTDDDRDADGRMPWSFAHRTGEKSTGTESASPQKHAQDPSQERGNQLDLDA